MSLKDQKKKTWNLMMKLLSLKQIIDSIEAVLDKWIKKIRVL